MKNNETKIKYFVYIRKSSDREDSQMLSLEAQKREIKSIEEKYNLKFVEYIEESASAYKTGRRKFNEMLKRIREGEANGIFVYHLSRIARNSEDGGRVIYMMDEGLLKEIRTPEKAYYSTISDDKFMMQIHFAMAKKSSDDTSQYVKRDIQSKILKGECPNSAPLGYLNLDKYGRISGIRFDNKKQEMLEMIANKENRKLKRIEPDPFLAPIIAELFNLYSQNIYSLDYIRKEAYKMGLRGLRSGEILSKSTTIRILSNPFYYGAIQWTGETHDPESLPDVTRHSSIIDKELFKKVQGVLNNKSKPRKQVHSYKYTGIIRCGECGKMVTAEIQKGIVYYRCTKKKKMSESICSQRYIREDELEKQIQEKILEYTVPKEFADWAIEVLNSNNVKESENRKAILAQQRKQLTEIEQQLDQLLKLKISPNNTNGEMLSDEEYLNQKNSLLKEATVLREKIASIEKNAENWLEHCEQFFEFAVNCERKWQEGSPEVRKFIFSTLFGSNATLKDRKLTIEAEKPFFKTAILKDLSIWRG